MFTLWILITIVFSLIRLMPEGPFMNNSMSAQVRESLQAAYNLDGSFIEQYFTYIGNLVQGNFGISMIRRGHQITETIATTFSVSAIIGFVTVFFSIAIGIVLGISTALRHRKITNKVLFLLITLANTIPSFLVAIILVHFLEIRWRLLPPTGFGSPYHYIVPIIALGFGCVAFVARAIRIRLMDIRNSDYMRTARAKGLSEKTIIVKHGLRNALIPTIRYLVPLLGILLTSAFAIESIFFIPGLAREFVQGASNGDYTMLLGITTFFCIFLIISNFVTDMLYLVINPSKRYQREQNNGRQ